MTSQRQLAELLALINKAKIEQNRNLSIPEKEYWKQFVDELKKQVK